MASSTMKNLVLALIIAFGTLGSAYADTMADRHQAKGVSCAMCHVEAPPAKKVKTTKCQQCHGDYAKLAERTKTMTPNNVHANHLGDLDCRECHGAHKVTKIACDECHKFQFAMPKKPS